MSAENRLPDYIDLIRQEATDACDFVDALSRKEFLDDKRTQKAVIMSIVGIGEATTRIMKRYPEFLDAHPEIPWKDMRDTRNRVAHGYFEINLDKVWIVVKEDLPELLKQLSAIELE